MELFDDERMQEEEQDEDYAPGIKHVATDCSRELWGIILREVALDNHTSREAKYFGV